MCFALMVGGSGRVLGIDHVGELVALAEHNTRKSHSELLASGRLEYRVADGRLGYPPGAKYDVIHAGAGTRSIPQAWIEQLNAGGLLLAPVGSYPQTMTLVAKGQDGRIDVKPLIKVVYVPLTDLAKQVGGGSDE